MGNHSSNSFDKPIVFYDGVCNLCNGAVQFILKHEKSSVLQFASLQSEFAKKLIRQNKIPSSVDSIIFYENNNFDVKSRAAFRIAQHLKPPWSFVNIFSFLPKSVTNAGYDLIARYRYRIFGKKETCPMPSKETRDRFIDI
jgi:predicted DCC family thiol-disulfide oxidoreductase YuxK